MLPFLEKGHILYVSNPNAKGTDLVPKNLRRKLGLKPGGKVHMSQPPHAEMFLPQLKSFAFFPHQVRHRNFTIVKDDLIRPFAHHDNQADQN